MGVVEFTEGVVVHSGCGCFSISSPVTPPQNDKAYVNWSPSELTVADVQSLYSAGSEDTWTIIEDTQIDVSDLTVPDPILESGSSMSEGNTKSNLSDQENGHVLTGENGVTFTPGEKDVRVPPPRPPPPQHENVSDCSTCTPKCMLM